MSPKILNILLVVLSGVLYMYVIDPLYTGNGTLWVPSGSISTLKALNEQYSATLAQIDTVQQGVDGLHNDYSKLSVEDQEKIKTMLPNTVDEIKLRHEVLTIAAKSGLGVALQNLNVKKSQIPYKGYPYYVVTFSLQSRYTPFKKLIEAYDRNLRFYNLETVSLSRKAELLEDNLAKNSFIDKDVLDISVKFRVYQMK